MRELIKIGVEELIGEVLGQEMIGLLPEAFIDGLTLLIILTAIYTLREVTGKLLKLMLIIGWILLIMSILFSIFR